MSEYDYSLKIQQIQQSNTNLISNIFNVKKEENGTDSFANIINNLGDYSLIKSGNYSKLVKAYYEKVDQEGSDIKDEDIDSSQSLLLNQKDNEDLAKSAEELKNFDFDNKEEKDDAEYWINLIQKAQTFVKAYNAVIKTASDLNNIPILKRAIDITEATSVNSNLLSKIGITINSDNSITIDENKLKEAEKSDIKTLFSGYNSYISKVSEKAKEIANLSYNTAITIDNLGARYYSANGSYSKLDLDTLLSTFNTTK